MRDAKKNTYVYRKRIYMSEISEEIIALLRRIYEIGVL